MRHYISPNTQVVRLYSGDVLDTISLGVGGSGAKDGGIQNTAMSPRRIYT